MHNRLPALLLAVLQSRTSPFSSEHIYSAISGLPGLDDIKQIDLGDPAVQRKVLLGDFRLAVCNPFPQRASENFDESHERAASNVYPFRVPNTCALGRRGTGKPYTCIPGL